MHLHPIFLTVACVTRRQSRQQDILYHVCRAQQALLDGQQSLCWQACERASQLFREQPLSDLESSVFNETVNIVSFHVVRPCSSNRGLHL